jgi:hypothetical protein
MTEQKSSTSTATDKTSVVKGTPTPAHKPRDAQRQRPADGSAGAATAPELPSIRNADPTPKPPRQTKAALLRMRLAEPGGVSLAVLIEATGWQAHTLRAALTGLRKVGLTITRRRKGTNTIYAIEGGSVAATGDGTLDAARSVLTTPEGSDDAANAPSASVPAKSDV